MEEYLTHAEAANILGKDVAATLAFLGTHHVPRFVRRSDLLLAMAAGQGSRSDMCVRGKQHSWGPREEDMSGNPLVWCTRKGCNVGVVLNGESRTTYRRRVV